MLMCKYKRCKNKIGVKRQFSLPRNLEENENGKLDGNQTPRIIRRQNTLNPENSQSELEKQQNEKLLRLMTGYGQHAMPIFL
jgi:hypothetical protein